MSWLGGTVQRWFALVSVVATVVGVATFAVTEHLKWAWLAIAGLLLLAASLAWTAHDEHRKRIAADEATHRPPGGGIPLLSPVEYQVNALRHVIPRLSEVMDRFGYMELDAVMKNLPRRGVDPVYEPLRTWEEGLARLVELGELERVNQGSWRIVKT